MLLLHYLVPTTDLLFIMNVNMIFTKYEMYTTFKFYLRQVFVHRQKRKNVNVNQQYQHIVYESPVFSISEIMKAASEIIDLNVCVCVCVCTRLYTYLCRTYL